LGLIGSAVLTFIGYKQTNKHPDKTNLYIEEKKGKANGGGEKDGREVKKYEGKKVNRWI